MSHVDVASKSVGQVLLYVESFVRKYIYPNGTL